LDIQKMLSDLDQDAFKTDLHFITQFPHRNARQSNNNEIEQIKKHIVDTLPTTQIPVSVDLITHKRTPQKSIHIQIQGKNPERHIVLGGHIDSINMGWGSSQAPGADDNASGSTAILQILRTILKSNYQPQNTLNFFWYAGEEQGLIGSAEIAKQFRLQNKDVIAALQLDMLGVPDQAEHIYLEQDFSSPKLNQLLNQVAKNYLPHLSLKNTSCGYPCSDHSSWYQEKYPVTFPTSGNPRSSQSNRLIHTAKDLPSTLNWDYALNVTRLSLAFILTADREL
ncbi:MAG: M20/M25/M40 family metallo-hydrolase, partial [Bdellovibrionaceae bacterium]|nr:M20/M25/M40 family metallo-hydrolase [Pseudobdellovibrionaceae bacterium]